ncbi:MAG: caspase family protein, partial [Spirochaetia bacterium]|nr:caspase family protein [Spirochaetia bacterium]
MKTKIFLTVTFLGVFSISLGAMERFALLVGANDGGKTRVKLSYAESDARNIERVLSSMGGLSESNSILLSSPTLEGVLSGLTAVKDKIRAGKSGDRVEFLFYYSGHSDEKGLLLRGDRFEYQDLKKQIKDMPGNVKIAILDSCASGVLTRLKGGQHVLPFEMDVSSEARGYAFLTSSAAAESSQESDAIKASFFTHYLASGLRGAADLNGDGKVSLQEAYQFAFQETLQRTERTKDGPQHPGYDIQMSGAGDLVLTDLRGTESRILIDAPLLGKFFIRDEQGYLTAEINKSGKRQMAIGVEPGHYQITLIQDEKSFSASV